MNSDTNWVKIIFILIQKWQHYTLGKICDMLVRWCKVIGWFRNWSLVIPTTALVQWKIFLHKCRGCNHHPSLKLPQFKTLKAGETHLFRNIEDSGPMLIPGFVFLFCSIVPWTGCVVQASQIPPLNKSLNLFYVLCTIDIIYCLLWDGWSHIVRQWIQHVTYSLILTAELVLLCRMQFWCLDCINWPYIRKCFKWKLCVWIYFEKS